MICVKLSITKQRAAVISIRYLPLWDVNVENTAQEKLHFNPYTKHAFHHTNFYTPYKIFCTSDIMENTGDLLNETQRSPLSVKLSYMHYQKKSTFNSG
jgi:hypothetical protein